MKKAVILLSGGLDSATCLAVAIANDYECYALSFDYGQRHEIELAAAREIAKGKVAEHKIIGIDLTAWGGSSLTSDAPVPDAGSYDENIPSTYVPARNLIFLAFATAYAEAIDAKDIFIGVNSVDYSGYPDCRPEFIRAFTETARLGTKAVDENWQYNIHTPLQELSKAEIIKLGTSLNVDYSKTHSCYNPSPTGLACGTCDSCTLRQQGFSQANIPDPTKYR